MMKFLFTTFIIITLLTNLSNAVGTQPLLEQPDLEPLPIVVGEVLVYNAKIGFFPFSAGKQILRIVKETEIAGQPVYHLKAVAETKGFFSRVYKFKNLEESFVTKDKFYPILFKKDIQDRGYKANYRIDFDLFEKKAIIVKDAEQKEMDIIPGIQDELSMLYLLRTKKLKIGNRYKFQVLISSKIYDVVLHVLRRESRETAIGKIDTLVLKASNGYKLWISDNDSRIPIRIEADTKIGAKLVAELEEVKY